MGVKSFMIQAAGHNMPRQPPQVYESELRRGMLQIRLSAETKSQHT
jgi:hypothetical protein